MTKLKLYIDNYNYEDYSERGEIVDALSVAKLLLSFKSVTYKKLQQLLFLLQCESIKKRGIPFFRDICKISFDSKTIKHINIFEVEKLFKKYGRRNIPYYWINRDIFSPEEQFFIKKFIDNFVWRSKEFLTERIAIIVPKHWVGRASSEDIEKFLKNLSR